MLLCACAAWPWCQVVVQELGVRAPRDAQTLNDVFRATLTDAGCVHMELSSQLLLPSTDAAGLMEHQYRAGQLQHTGTQHTIAHKDNRLQTLRL